MLGNWNTVFRRFSRWAQTSIFEQLFQVSTRRALKGDLCSGYRAFARRLATKVVALVDALGNLTRFLLLPVQRHDSVGAEPLLDGIEIGTLIADKGFDNDVLRRELDARGATAVILPKANRTRQIACDFAMCHWRHLAESFFCDLKQFRRIATRYDKTDLSFSEP